MHFEPWMFAAMEDEGMIVSVPGRGSFVSENLSEMLAKQVSEQESKLLTMLRTCRELGLTKENVVRLAEKAYKEEELC